MTHSAAEEPDDAGLPAALAAQRRRAIRMLVPGVLLTFAGPTLLLLDWGWTGVCAQSAGAALIAVWAFRQPGDAGRGPGGS